MGDHQQKMF